MVVDAVWAMGHAVDVVLDAVGSARHCDMVGGESGGEEGVVGTVPFFSRAGRVFVAAV